MWLLWFSIDVYIYISLSLPSLWFDMKLAKEFIHKTDDLIKNTSHFVGPSVSDSSFPRRWLTSLACKIGMKRLPPSRICLKNLQAKQMHLLGFFPARGSIVDFPFNPVKKTKKKISQLHPQASSPGSSHQWPSTVGVSIELFLARKNNTQFPIYQYKVVIETYPCPKKIDLPLPAGSISAIWNGKTILEETPLGGGCSPHVPKVAIKVGTYCQESLLVYKPHELSTIDIYIYNRLLYPQKIQQFTKSCG